MKLVKLTGFQPIVIELFVDVTHSMSPETAVGGSAIE